jgi:hypothetical protein
MFCNDYKCVFLVFQTYVASVSIASDVYCKCFIDVAKKDFVVINVAVGPICSSHQLQLLSAHGCEGAPRYGCGTRSTYEPRCGRGTESDVGPT